MSCLTLRLKYPLAQRIDMSPFTPESLAGKSAHEIARIPVWQGNRQIDLGELFEIEGSASEQLIIQSESDRLDCIGADMSSGKIIVEGSAGAYLGCAMKSGEILVTGDAGVAAGCAMKSGRLTIKGNAGDFLGGALTGERQGMRGGSIIVKGNAGDRAGDLMRRGTILIGGNSGDYCASRMVAGTIIVGGKSGKQTGMAMRRGTLITGNEPTSLPATFNDNGQQTLSFLALLSQNIPSDSGFDNLIEKGTRVQRWLGDLSCDGKGEILIWCS
ncbi:MAG: formylmethanofuran dehydrogenase subunit C [Candidatus Thiodiazotropha sp. 6PLUC2]